MVLGICRHVLNQHQDAEDAFQATFLVLARKGATIRNRRVLAGWLHEVAHRIAIKARASAVRRRTIERQGMAMSPPAIEPDNQDEAAAWNELRPVLHAEVERLPDKYRIPVILSYLEGKTNEEVAELLRWPVGTVKGRLSRARDLLRSRLMRRGLALVGGVPDDACHRDGLRRGRPAELVRRTVRLAGKFGPRRRRPTRPVPNRNLQPSRVPDASRLADAAQAASLRFSRRNVGLVLVAVLSFSIAAGIWLAMLGPVDSRRSRLLSPRSFPGWSSRRGATESCRCNT